MTRLTHCEFHRFTSLSTIEKVAGYTFEVDVDGKPFGMGVHKNALGQWWLVDLSTGLGIGSRWFRRRVDAVDTATCDGMREALAEMDKFEHEARKQVFARMVGGEEIPYRQYIVEVDELSKRLREQFEAGELEMVAAEATVSALERWRGAMRDWSNVAVVQKNERCLVWVFGETAPHGDELREMGFTPSKKKGGWWIRP